MYKAATYYLLLKKRVNGFVKEILIGMFRIPRWPWEEHDSEANAGGSTSLQKQRQTVNLPLSRWKTIEILKIIRFQRLHFFSKSKGYLLQTTKLWEKQIVLNRRRKKVTKPKEEVNFLSLKRVKFVKMTILIFISFSYLTS